MFVCHVEYPWLGQCWEPHVRTPLAPGTPISAPVSSQHGDVVELVCQNGGFWRWLRKSPNGTIVRESNRDVGEDFMTVMADAMGVNTDVVVFRLAK